MMKDFYGSGLLTTLSLLILILTFLVVIKSYAAITTEMQMPLIAYNFMLGWLGIAILFVLVSYKEFVVGFLIALFSMLIAWRIGAIYAVNSVMYWLFVSFALFLLNFLYCVWINLKESHTFLHALSFENWQLVFIRLYIGFDFVPHFTEKLFAGPLPHAADVDSFVKLGVPHPDFFVWLAGFCELGAAIALGLGFLMRLGSLGAVVYLLIATYLGHHFSLGFIWANPGGGWEFAMMWMVLIFSFVLTGSHSFSLDQRLEDWLKLPSFIRKLL
jgi:putative oxidoreductase